MLFGIAVVLIAAEPVWKKPIPSWTEEDARQILTSSPWSKGVTAAIAPLPTEAQRREGGEMGELHGIGYDGVDDGKPRPALPTSLFGKSSEPGPAPRPPNGIRLLVRWESALPVRAAELKSRQDAAPTPSEGGYIIAVYGIPGSFFGDPKRLGNPLKNLAVLQHGEKKGVKPFGAEVYQLESGAAVVYTFPGSEEIGEQDGPVTFIAHIGRLQVSQTFQLAEMQYDGKLQL
jgi:hypothetical protein